MFKKLGKSILWQRTCDYLRRYQPTLIGVTGSTGKTMTKEAIALAISDDFRLRISPQSYNTPIGVALSILGVKRQSTAAGWIRLLAGSKIREIMNEEPNIIVLELGADQPGDIDFFSRKMSFNIGVVTNVRSTHLRLFVTKDMVAHEKMSLVAGLPEEGFAILNANDSLVAEMKDHTKAKTIFFGESDQANVRLRRINRLKNYGLAGELLIQGKIYELNLPHIIAKYHVPNILASLAVALALEIDIKSAVNRLHQLKPPPGRMHLLSGANQSLIIDDSYNASPESAILALQTLSEISAYNHSKKRRRIAVLGDMLDLGGQSIAWHKKIGEHAATNTSVLITVGEAMRAAGAAALKKDNTTDVHHFNSSRDVGKWLRDFLHERDIVLVKGSRNMQMEKVTKRLLANPKQDISQLIQSD